MDMISVQSSQIAQIGYDGQSTLRVLFRRGGLYEYAGVTATEFKELRDAESIGSHFGRYIKGAKPVVKVEGSEFPKVVVETSVDPDRDAMLSALDAAEKAVGQYERGESVLPPAEAENQEVEQVAQKANLLVQNAKSIKVIDPTTQHQASQTLLAIAALRKEVADTFKPMKDAAFRAHRTICEQEKKHDGPLAEAEAAVKQQIGGFIERERQVARAAEEANRKAEMERAQREAEAESQRRAIEDAITLESMGDSKSAEAVLANPAPVPVHYVAPAPVAPRVAQVAGVSTREDWDFRITDESQIPREYMLVNESAIRNLGKTTKGRAKIAGVEFYPKQVVAASRRG